MDPNQPLEKRRFSRVPFGGVVELADQTGRRWNCELEDISIKGVLLEVPEAHDPVIGDRCRLTLTLEEAEVEIAMDLTVAHITGKRVGLYCIQIDAESLMHLRRLMELNLGNSELLDRDLQNLGESTGP